MEYAILALTILILALLVIVFYFVYKSKANNGALSSSDIDKIIFVYFGICNGCFDFTTILLQISTKL